MISKKIVAAAASVLLFMPLGATAIASAAPNVPQHGCPSNNPNCVDTSYPNPNGQGMVTPMTGPAALIGQLIQGSLGSLR